MTNDLAACHIEIGVDESSQLFDEFDRSPRKGRHLDANIVRLILHRAEERRTASYALSVRVRDNVPSAKEAAVLATAIRDYFAHSAREAADKLHVLVSNGKRDLVVGFLFLFVCGGVGLVAGKLLPPSVGGLVQEGFVIIGWVALWRPVDLFLYELRPLRHERDLLDALCDIDVRFEMA